MEKLNLPDIAARIRMGKNGKQEIYDGIRKKFVRLTPEEWVRQHFLHFMILQLGFPATLIVVEGAMKYNNMAKRFDILAYRTDGKPCMVVECIGLRWSEPAYTRTASAVTMPVEELLLSMRICTEAVTLVTTTSHTGLEA